MHARGIDDRAHLVGILGDPQQVQVAGRDAPVAQRAVAQPVDQTVPLAADQDTGKWRIVPVWISVSASNSSSSVPKPPGAITKALA